MIDSGTTEMRHFFAVAWEAATAAGELIRSKLKETKEVHYKSAIDLVTTVDRESEDRIVGILTKHFPEHSVLAEEKTEIVSSRTAYRWIIDPLDGTTNFAHGYPHVSVSIALEKEGEVILGLVYDPLRNERFAAAKGEGAYLDRNSIQTSRVAELDRALLATGFPYDRREQLDFYLRFYKAFLARCQGIRRNGSAALDLCYVACGRIDGFWEFKLHPWDTAAGGLIVREAGGTLSDFSGHGFSIWGEETLASNGLIHGEMLRVLQEVREIDGSIAR